MKKWLLYFLIGMVFFECRERYDVPFYTPDTGFLVVEGIINTLGETRIMLSRTTKLSENRLVLERGAIVKIQAEDNSEYVLFEGDSASYIGNYAPLNKNMKYRLNIKTSDSKEYVSEFSSPIETPEIDSLSWTRGEGKVEVFLDSHDSTNKTSYYKWDVDETWEFESSFQTVLKYDINNNVSPAVITVNWANGEHKVDESVLRCWKYRPSTGIRIASTIKLSETRIHAPLISYGEGAWELSDLYSVNVKQYALSQSGYEFYDKMRKNTETRGSIFDTQPTELQGNITCVTNPSEMVIGYIEVCNATEKRLFINNSELPGWNTDEGCVQTGYYDNDPDLVFAEVYTLGLLPTFQFSTDLSGNVRSFYAAPSLCVDCTLRGSNVKPPYWP